MTLDQHSEPKRNVYDACDPIYLRQLREAAGMDLSVLARTACLSVAQVRQLETEDSDNFFYSEAIKRQAYKRLLMILGAEPPTVEIADELRDPARVAQAHLDTLDQIVAMATI
jgi:transcriptional regulator with XRE-family HTH domain